MNKEPQLPAVPDGPVTLESLSAQIAAMGQASL